VKKIRTDKPAYVIYEGEWQQVAEPFRKGTMPRRWGLASYGLTSPRLIVSRKVGFKVKRPRDDRTTPHFTETPFCALTFVYFRLPS
jgi:hypothetical protein